jgi:hypothetical protein
VSDIDKNNITEKEAAARATATLQSIQNRVDLMDIWFHQHLDRMENVLIDLQTQAKTEIISTIGADIADIETLITNTETNLSSSLTVINNNITAVSTNVANGFTTTESNIKLKLAQVEDNLTANIKTVESKVDTIISSINANISNDIIKIENAIKAFESNLTTIINNFMDEVSGKIDIVKEYIHNEIVAQNTNIQNIIEDTQKRIDSRIVESHNILAGGIDRVERNISAKIENIQNQESTNTQDIIDTMIMLYDRFEEFITKQFDPTEDDIVKSIKVMEKAQTLWTKTLPQQPTVNI